LLFKHTSDHKRETMSLTTFLALTALLSIIFFFITSFQRAKRTKKPSVSYENDLVFYTLALPSFYKKESQSVCNKAFAQAFGAHAKEALAHIETFPKKGSVTTELTFDNDVRKSVQISFSTLFGQENTPIGYSGIIVDISSFQKNKENLLHQKERLELALEGNDEAFWDWDIQTESVFFSPKWKHIMGYAPNETPSTLSSWLNLVHTKDMAVVNERLKAHLDGKSDIFSIEHRIRQSDPLQWVRVKAKAIRDKRNQAIRMVGTLKEITYEKAALQNTTLENERYAAFFEQLPVLAFIKNRQGPYLYLNRAFQKFLGFKTWQSKTAHELFDAKTADTIDDIDRLSFFENRFNHTLELSTQEGLVVTFEVYTFIIDTQDADKVIGGFCINKSFKL